MSGRCGSLDRNQRDTDREHQHDEDDHSDEQPPRTCQRCVEVLHSGPCSLEFPVLQSVDRCASRKRTQKRRELIDAEQAVAMIVNGFCKEVFDQLPMDFAVEAQKLLEISLEGSVG